MPPSVAVGDKVLVPEYGGTKVVFDDQVRHRLWHIFGGFDWLIFFRTTLSSGIMIFWEFIKAEAFQSIIDSISQRVLLLFIFSD